MNETTSIEKANKFKSVVQTAQSALLLNQTSVQKASAACRAVLDTIEGEGMSDKLDEACNDILVKCRKTDTLMKERRSPVTQLFTIVTKEFTGLEKELKDAAEPLKTARDAYATKKAIEQRNREIVAQKKLDIEKEKIRVTTDAEVELSKFFNDHLTGCKKLIYSLFRNVTLESFMDVAETLDSYSVVLNSEYYFKFTFRFFVTHISSEDANLILKQTLDTKYDHYAQLFSKEMEDYRVEHIDKLPSKKTELEAIADAERQDSEEVKRLKDLREKREKEEDEKLAKEAAEREAKEATDAEVKAQEANMESMFDNIEQITQPESKAQVRSGYIITITHPAGWVIIFQLWFEIEGKNLGIDVLGRKSLNQIKGWAEKHALKTGEKITSPYVKYEETFKTVAKSKSIKDIENK